MNVERRVIAQHREGSYDKMAAYPKGLAPSSASNPPASLDEMASIHFGALSA